MLTVFLEKLLLMKETACYDRTGDAHYFSENSFKLVDTPNVAGMRTGRRQKKELGLVP
jgi:hypothetical protein